MQKRWKGSILLVAVGIGAAWMTSAASHANPDAIRLNQLGFYPGAPKAAFVAGPAGETFVVKTAGGADTVFRGRLGAQRVAEHSTDATRLADFTAVRAPGRYVVAVEGVGESHPFDIAPRVHESLTRAALKAFYFQRASMPLEARYAGEWSRAAGHPDDEVIVHPSAAGPERQAGSVISSPGGWYDAGDYNKYVVNSGITVATLLSLHEDFPDFVRSLDAGIPESGDTIPDLIDEVLWNVRWMLTMQDPADGGVYHKLTTPQFEGFVTPASARLPRYVVQKSTAATLDFAAVMAQASRVLRAYADELPGVADSTLAAALSAWRWARRDPDVLYDQGRLNERYDPDIETGAYGDRSVEDEFVWAATELGVTTGQDSFFTAVPVFSDTTTPLPSWGQVRTLAYYTLARFRDDLPPAIRSERESLERRLVRMADGLIEGAGRTAYGTVMGGSLRDYVWGSSAVAANQGIALVVVYRLTGDGDYLRHALANLDYLLGRNATGYSFVTGFGGRTPLHPHHRPSASDAVAAPVPGLLVGGPNPARQDRCDYPFEEPDRSYVDDVCSYASNEIAINWNAPLVYLAGALEALQYDAGFSEPRASQLRRQP